MDERPRRLLFLIAVYVALPSGLILAMLIGWMVATENATAVLQSADSPDGRYRAEVVREDPGVSSKYEFRVRLTPANLTPLAEKLKLLPFGPQYIALSVDHEPDQLAAAWSSNERVTIMCAGCGGASIGKSRWRDIQLEYQVH